MVIAGDGAVLQENRDCRTGALCSSLTSLILDNDQQGTSQTIPPIGLMVFSGGRMYKVELLEKKRLEKGLSYTEIAETLGMDKVTVARTLKGVNMKPRTVKMLADYLGVDMEILVP